MNDRDPDRSEQRPPPDRTGPQADGKVESPEEGETSRRKRQRRVRARRRILQSTAVLPGLATTLNLLSGFAAIHFAAKDALGEALGSPESMNLTIAGGLIFLAMVMDVLDGRLARMTRRTSDLGGQLDSLADVVSFGAAPAVLMHRTVIAVLHGQIRQISAIPHQLAATSVERFVWCVAAVYLACAALRLARFNVENEPDESAHMDFRGLPSPAAAAVVASLVLLLEHLRGIDHRLLSSPAMLATVGVLLPAATLVTGLLMVSRFRYSHVVNQYIRGRRPFSYLVKLVVIIIAMFLEPFVTVAAVAIIYALSGPTGAVTARLRRRTG